MRTSRIACIATTFALGLLACGGDPGSTFGDPQDPAMPKSDVPAGANIGEIGPKGTGSACVSEVASAELAPTNLVFIYDKSGSMGDAATGFDPAKKWVPVGTGL